MSFYVKLYLEKKIENKTKSGRESSSTRNVYSMKLKTRQSIRGDVLCWSEAGIDALAPFAPTMHFQDE